MDAELDTQRADGAQSVCREGRGTGVRGGGRVWVGVGVGVGEGGGSQ